MRLTQKRNCNGCKASQEFITSLGSSNYCILGIRTKEDDLTGVSVPLSPCLKPKTNNELTQVPKP